VAIAVSQDDASAAAIGDLGSIGVWDVASGASIGGTIGTAVSAEAIAFAPDGTLAIADENDESVLLWRQGHFVPGGRLLSYDDAGQHPGATSLAFSRDGTLAVADHEGGLQLWDIATRQPIGMRLSTANRMHADVLEFSGDGTALVSGERNGVVRLWDGFLWRDGADLRRRVCDLLWDDLNSDEWRDLAPPRLAYHPICTG
jgi:WD40 repeat protein